MIVPAPRDKLLAEFDRCWPWLEEANELSGLQFNGTIWVTHDKDHIWRRVMEGRAYLWPGEESAVLTEFLNHPTGLKSHNTWLAGGNLQEIVPIIGHCEDWGRDYGCHRQVGNGRRGWLRVLTGYTEYGVRKQKSLLVGESSQLHRH